MGNRDVRIRYTADTSDLEAAQKKVGKAIGGAGDEAVKAKGKFKGQEEATKKVSAESKNASTSMKGMATSALALGAAMTAAAKVSFDLANASSQMVDDMVLLSRRVGLSTETLIALGDAAGRGGSDLQSLEFGLAAFTAKAGEAARKGGAAAEVFEELGVSVTDSGGALRDMDVILPEVLDAIGALGSDTQKAAAAAAIFGARGSEIVAVLGASSAPLEESRAKTAALAAAYEDAADASVEMDAALANLSVAADQATLAFGSALTPEVAQMINLMASAVTTTAEWADELDDLRSAANLVFGGGFIVDPLKDLATWATAADEATEGLTEAITDLGIATDEAAEGVKAVGREWTKADTAKALKRQKEAEAALTAAVKERTEAQLAAAGVLSGLQAQEHDITVSRLDEIDRIKAARDAELAQLDELAMAHAENAEIMGQIAANRILLEEDAQQQIGAIQSEAIAQRSEAEREAVAQASEAREAAHAEELQRIQDEFTARQMATTAFVAFAADAGQAMINIQEIQGKQGKQAALKTFRAGQALAVAQTTFFGIQAAAAALAPPPVGAGPILGPAIALGIGATTALQLTEIAKQEPPTFHSGGVVNADLLPGEAVLNRSAAAKLGEQAINDLNARPGSASLGGSVTLRIGRLEAREIIRTDLRAGGLIAQTAKRAAAATGPATGMSGNGVLA